MKYLIMGSECFQVPQGPHTELFVQSFINFHCRLREYFFLYKFLINSLPITYNHSLGNPASKLSTEVRLGLLKLW